MRLKNLFDARVKEEIIGRINNLAPQSQAQWGKMNVAQMLAHVQQPIGVVEGMYKLPRTLFGRIFGPLAKPIIYNDRPFKRNLPTDKSFVMLGQEKDFEKEKLALIIMIQNFQEDNLVNEPHPFFGKLTKEQWSTGTWKHLDHHLQQFGV